MSETTEVVEEVVDTVARIPKLALNGTTTKQQVIILSATALTGAVVGGVVTFFGSKKRFELKYEALKDEEVAQAKDFYMRLGKAGPYAEPPKSKVEEAADVAASYAPSDEQEPPQTRAKEPLNTDKIDYTLFSKPAEQASVSTESEDQPTQEILERVADGMVRDAVNRPSSVPADVEHVFRVSADKMGFDYDKELIRRRALPLDVPYLITQDEYMTNLEDNEQDALVYWVEDQTLSDSREIVVEKDVVGRPNLARFGEGSGEANTVYVHNPVKKIDYEITRSLDSYAKAVHNIDVGGELEHSDEDYMPHRRKRRREG